MMTFHHRYYHRDFIITLLTSLFCLTNIVFEKHSLSNSSSSNSSTRYTTTNNVLLSSSDDYEQKHGRQQQQQQQISFPKQILPQQEIRKDIDNNNMNDPVLTATTTTTSKTNRPWNSIVPSNIISPPQPMVLPLLDWEIASSLSSLNNNTRICNPPNNIPQSCCLGTTHKLTNDIAVYENQCRNDITIHNQLANYTIQYLNQHNQIHDINRGNRMMMILPKQECDICRIIDYLMIYNWTLAIQGDSISRQSFNGLKCELRRRGYDVITNTTGDIYKEIQPIEYHWKYGIREIITLYVSWPNRRTNNTIDDTTELPPRHNNNSVAKIVYYFMYRPTPDNKDIDEIIIPNSDIIVFDHGLHYLPNEYNTYLNEMINLLRAYKQNRTIIDQQMDHKKHPWANKTDFNNNNYYNYNDNKNERPSISREVDNNLQQEKYRKRLKLVAWRQTSAQHFHSIGGHHTKSVRPRKCVPHPKKDGTKNRGFHLKSMKMAAHAINYTVLDVYDRDFFDTSTSMYTARKNKDQDELIILPYRDYTSPLYYLHPNECTHYCNDPHLWIPIWRTLRLAMDRTVQIHEQEMLDNKEMKVDENKDE